MAAVDLGALLARHPLVDGHNDLPWHARVRHRYDLDSLDLAGGNPAGQTDLPRLRQGCVGAQFWSVYVPSSQPEANATVATLEQIDFVHRMVERHGEDLGLATSAAELEAVFRAGKIASLIGAEGGHSIASSLSVLRMLYALGTRYLTLTHNHNTPWADSATDIARHGGLTGFGREVVREMNRLGMIVDLSHVAHTTMRDALAVSEAPVMFSHSSAYSVTSTPRNVPDDVLATVAAQGGVVMAVFVSYFASQRVWDHMQEADEAARAEGVPTNDLAVIQPWFARWKVTHPAPVATVDDVVAHIEHIREVAGLDHVGLGGDYDGATDFPEGMDDVTAYPAVLAALADRGWSEAELIKVAGANVIRVLRDVESTGRSIQATRPPSTATIEDIDGPDPTRPV